MDKQKRKKICYIPGTISLAILPFIFIWFAHNEIKTRTVGVIPIFLIDTNLSIKYPELFKNYRGPFPPRRNYIEINLTGQPQDDTLKLHYSQTQIREILSKNDTTQGVHFKFNDSSEYWTFVAAIDLLRFEGAKSYTHIDKDLWFYNFSSDSARQSDLKCFLCGDILIIGDEKSWKTKLIEQTKNIWSGSWEIIICFSIFLLLIPTLPIINNGR